MQKLILAANTVEIAKPHIMNLQLFAEGEPEPAPEPSPEPTPSEPNEPSSEPATNLEPTESDVTQTQVFSKRLKEATQKAIDEEYARLYGAEYGIYSKADYDKAIAEARAAEERAKIQEKIGVDPDELKPVFEKWKENDPDFQELKAIRAEKNINSALTDFNESMQDLGMDIQLKSLEDDEVSKLPNIDKITHLVKQGHSLSDAFFLANKKDIIVKRTEKAQQEAIAKITANGASSPGSLAGGGEGQGKSIFSMDGADFKKLQEEVLRGERKKL